jgi:hypothetical protein
VKRARALLAVVLCACNSGGARFALRPPVLRDRDDVPLRFVPAKDDQSNDANTLDTALLRPMTHALLFERGGEARNVSSLDEVPDSTWFQNRRVTPAEVARGSCTGEGPAPPFLVRSSKNAGRTPGFFVTDARGHRYLFKVDGLTPYGQPELSTAADAITSRLYWAVGFNVPCNRVIGVRAGDLRVDARSIETLPTGAHRRFTRTRLLRILGEATRLGDRTFRVSSSRFIDGKPLGVWRDVGTRPDDPNDVVPHEDRRELRGERFLAAWVAHWDSRNANTFDAFVRGGWVEHYFLDFSDSLGGTTMTVPKHDPRLGFETVSDLPTILADAVTLGLIRRPWDTVRVDPRFPDLGYFDVPHFDPIGFSPYLPLVRWSRAQPQDMAWMARRLSRLSVDDVRAAVRAGRLTQPGEAERLVEILMARRAKILRVSFARTSSLGDLVVRDGRRLCFLDFALATRVARPRDTSYAVELRHGASLFGLGVRRGEGGSACVEMPHVAPSSAADDSAARYVVVSVLRFEGGHKTVLRAHLYDLGPPRGYVLAGIERP